MEAEKESNSDSSMDYDSDEDDKREKELQENVGRLKKQLEGNPHNYDSYIELIKAFKELGSLDELRAVRNKMSEIYPLTPELWLDWLKDEQKICTTDDERSHIIGLFEKAVKDYTSVKLWLEYIMFMLGGGDNKATRSVCDNALIAVGTHVAEGLLIWEAIQLFEQEIYRNLASKEDPTEDEAREIKRQKEKVKNLYKRQMRVPLLNVDKDAVMEEAKEWFDGGIDANMKNDLEKMEKKLEKKLSNEKSLLSITNEKEKLIAYRLYLDHLKHIRENPADVQSLYERAITDNALDAKLWEEYIEYMMAKFPCSDFLILPICERSMRNCPWSGTLVDLFLTILQQSEESPEHILKKAKEVLDKGLASGTPDGGQITKMWLSYLVLLRRNTKWKDEDDDKTLSVELFKESCNNAISYLDKFYDDTADIECEIPRFFAHIIAELDHDIQAARDVWNNVILKKNDHYNNAQMWIDFIQLERSFGTIKHCRKLFRRALERVWDYVEVVVVNYRRFEQETGNVETMIEFNKRVEERMVHVNKRREELERKNSDEKHKHRGKTNMDKSNSFKNSKEMKSNNFKNANEMKSNNFKNSKEMKPNLGKSPETKNFPKKIPSNSPKDETIKSSEDKNVTMSDVNLKSKELTPQRFDRDVPPPPGFEDDIDPPPGFKEDDIDPPPGFNGGVKRKAEQPDHSPKKIKINPEHGEKVEHDPTNDPRSVFLSNLDFSTTEDQIREVINDCGQIESLRLAKDFRGRSKGFGYLVFINQSSVAVALKQDRVKVRGRPMFISPCNANKQGSQFKFNVGLEKEKLFIRGLPRELDEDAVKKIFEQHAPVKEMRLVTFRNGYSKGNCYITFENEEAAEKVRQLTDNTEIEGKLISVVISNPSKSNEKVNLELSSKSMKFDEPQANKMRPKLAFIPRSLQTKSVLPPKTTSANASDLKDVSQKTNQDFRDMLLKK